MVIAPENWYMMFLLKSVLLHFQVHRGRFIPIYVLMTIVTEEESEGKFKMLALSPE